MQTQVGAFLAEVGAALEVVPAVRVAYVFGSRASGRARPNSDLDVAVLYDLRLDADGLESEGRDALASLTDAFGRLGESADILDLERSGSAVSFRAIRDGDCVLARDRAERARLEARVGRRYDDEAPRRALIRRAAARAASRMEARLPGRS